MVFEVLLDPKAAKALKKLDDTNRARMRKARRTVPFLNLRILIFRFGIFNFNIRLYVFIGCWGVGSWAVGSVSLMAVTLKS